MWSIHELKRIVYSLPQAWRNKQNIESNLNKIENLVNELRELNYDNQCTVNMICKYWRAGCCKFGSRCRFKHLKINEFPLTCPYGRKCKRRINGKCYCVLNIRNKFIHSLTF